MVSNTAYARLSYGIAYDEDEMPVENGEQISGYEVADRAEGFRTQRQNAAVPEPPWGQEPHPCHGPEWDAWREALKEWEPGAVETMGRGYCNGDSGRVFYIAGSQREAEWTDVVEIDPADLTPDPVWDERLREAVTECGLPWKRPGWLLTAYYG